MIIKALVENTSISKNLKCEHGLSIYIETKLHKVLFDLGPGNLFIENARKMNVALDEVDIVIISHGHYDHGGGLKSFLELNNKAKIYINENAFEPYYLKLFFFKMYIGLDYKLQHSDRLVLTKGVYQIDEELQVFSDISEQLYCPPTNKNLLHKLNGRYIQDKFHHEQNLLIKENNTYALFAGCSHNGIVNILRKAETITGTTMEYVISGFHLYQLPTGTNENMVFLKEFAGELKKRNTRYFTCHCTGQKPYEILRQEMGEQMKYLSTGMEMNLKPMISYEPAYEDEYCIAYDCPDWNTTYLKWKKFCCRENYRRPLIYVLNILQKNHDVTAIFDVTNGYNDMEEDFRWAVQEYIPMMTQTKCKNIIFVTGNDGSLDNVVDTFVAEFLKYFTVHQCKSIVEAEKYLVLQQEDTSVVN